MRWMTAGMMAAGLAAGAGSAGAQVTLQPGAKVRITAPTAGVDRFEGTVIAAGDTLDVARGTARIRVPGSAVTRIELSRGKSRGAGALRGAMWGAGIGLGLGAITASTIEDEDYCDGEYGSLEDTCDVSAGEWIAASTVGGAFWGTIIGAIVGRERWDTITVPGTRTSMTLTPWVLPGGRAGLAVTLR